VQMQCNVGEWPTSLRQTITEASSITIPFNGYDIISINVFMKWLMSTTKSSSGKGGNLMTLVTGNGL